MTNWTETYRGAVPPWQCDVTEHFTIGFYFDRLEEAEANLAHELGLGELLGQGTHPRRVDARFVKDPAVVPLADGRWLMVYTTAFP